MWGPQANTGLLSEPFTDSPGGRRTVQYYDKSRMEITNLAGDPGSLWYVTNGLLAKELVTGASQTRPDSFEQHAPSQSNVSADPGGATVPTYASFKPLLESAPLPAGWTIIQTVDRSGHTGDDPSLVSLGITAAAAVAETNHTVASVFWDFMNSSERVMERRPTVPEPLLRHRLPDHRSLPEHGSGQRGAETGADPGL